MKEKRYLPWLIGTLIITLLIIVGYGYGQAKYPSIFLAYSTMNEEFAKGIPLILQSGGRIQATFAGHYDLAAYLVMIIPLIFSFLFGFKNIFYKLLFITTSILALILLLLTASRTSFAVYLCAIVFLLVLLKKKLWIIPVFIVSLALLLSFHTLAIRFADTITQQQVVVNALNGQQIGITSKTKSGKVTIVQKTPVGQELTPGSITIVSNTSPVEQTTTQVVLQRTVLHQGTESAQITNLQGDFVVKNALALDESFTTRFQGEWPRAIDAFTREPLLGSGYSSISLASDDNYLRMLGETGILGLLSFLFIFLITAIYATKILPDVDSLPARSLVIGTLAGIFGLGLNAILIDVFEASKDAYTLWLLLGFTLGTLALYQKHKVDYMKGLQVLVSTPAMVAYFLICCFSTYGMSLNNFFVADDFTWLRWIADCKKTVLTTCEPAKTTFIHFFTNADGFFYRPMEKVYFYFMYMLFGFNPTPYHIASILIHWLCVIPVYILSERILKRKIAALIVAGLFMILSVHADTVIWISASGHLFVALFSLLALLFYDNYRLYQRKMHLVLSLISMLIAPMFHESGVVASMLVFFYALVVNWKNSKNLVSNIVKQLVLIIPLPIYFVIRVVAKSIWSAGDYRYNLTKLPFNFLGNLIGYFLITINGINLLPFYTALRTNGKDHLLLSGIFVVLLFLLFGMLVGFMAKRVKGHDSTILFVSIVLFVVPLLPFLGLGNLAPRYGYLSSFGSCLFLVFLFNKLLSGKFVRNTYVFRGIVALMLIIFGIYQFDQIVNENNDWSKAGQLSKNTLQVIADEYQKQNSLPPSPIFYFSNVPHTYKNALVFSDGMQDAIWMIFQNKNITVKETPSLAISLEEGEATTSSRYYEFDKNGSLTETLRTVITPTPSLAPKSNGLGK